MNWWVLRLQLVILACIGAAIWANPRLEQTLGSAVDAEVQAATTERTPLAASSPPRIPIPTPDVPTPETPLEGICEDDVNDVDLEGQPANRAASDILRARAWVTNSIILVNVVVAGPVEDNSVGPDNPASILVTLSSDTAAYGIETNLVQSSADNLDVSAALIDLNAGTPAGSVFASVDGSQVTLTADISALTALGSNPMFEVAVESGTFGRFRDRCASTPIT